jgi:hypothetical protein
MMMSKIVPRLVVVLGFTVFGIGCATTGPSPRFSDAELELAQRHVEDEVLARLVCSVSTDIADAAGTMARERAIR